MLKLFFSGLLIGIGAIMPGVSGGALAFILGIYDKLLEAVSNFFVCTKEERKKYFVFLCQVGLGVVLGILIFTRIIEFLHRDFKEPTNFLFIGLMLASLPTIFKENEGKINKFGILSLVGGVAIMLLFLQVKEPDKDLTFLLNQNFSNYYLFKLFICGIAIAAASIIPGLSSTVLMLLMGEYYNIVYYINNFKIKPLVFIGIGGVLGAVIFVKLLKFLFERYRSIITYGMLGLVAASVVGIWPGFSKENAFSNILCFIIGYSIMYFGEKMSKNREVK